MHIFRENTEDIYAGIEFMNGKPETEEVKSFLIDKMGVKSIRFPATSSIGIKPVSVEGTERLVRQAIKFAINKKLPSVTIVHKGNIMKFTEGSFMKWGYALAEREFGKDVFTWMQHKQISEKQGLEVADRMLREAEVSGKVIIKDVIADAFLQQILTRPAEYSVIATLNLNGDYISDALAAIVGGIGIAPGANINFESGHAIFEATHGTAPLLAGQDKANPCSLLLSAGMMLRYLGWTEAANRLDKAIETTIRHKTVTFDLAHLMEGATPVSTSAFADALIKNIFEK